MGSLSLTLPQIGQPNSTEDVKIVNAFTAIQTLLNGNVDNTNIADGGVGANELASTLADILGVTASGTVRRGKSIIATTETLSNPVYDFMPTPDRVSNIVLPTDGLIAVAYQATWQTSALNACAAGIFLNGNQLKWATGAAVPAVQEATGASPVNTDAVLATMPGGLASAVASAGYTGDVTTGQIVGNVHDVAYSAGPTYIFAAAGTYTVSVKFRASTGTVTAKNRKLWVWSMGF